MHQVFLPLFPLISIHVLEILSLMFNHALRLDILWSTLGNLQRMCHQQYIDDLIVLTTGDREDLRIIKLILYMFEGIAGLTINLQKTYLYTTRQGQLANTVIAQTINNSLRILLLTYLSIPVLRRKPCLQAWMRLIKKIRTRLLSLKKCLSLSCRLTLVYSMPFAIPSYWMPKFKILCLIIKEILIKSIETFSSLAWAWITQAATL